MAQVQRDILSPVIGMDYELREKLFMMKPLPKKQILNQLKKMVVHIGKFKKLPDPIKPVLEELKIGVAKIIAELQAKTLPIENARVRYNDLYALARAEMAQVRAAQNVRWDL